MISEKRRVCDNEKFSDQSCLKAWTGSRLLRDMIMRLVCALCRATLFSVLVYIKVSAAGDSVKKERKELAVFRRFAEAAHSVVAVAMVAPPVQR